MRTMCFIRENLELSKLLHKLLKVFPEKSLSLIVIMLTYHIKVSHIYLYISSYLLQIGLIGLFGQTACHASGCDDIIFLTIKRLFAILVEVISNLIFSYSHTVHLNMV